VTEREVGNAQKKKRGRLKNIPRRKLTSSNGVVIKKKKRVKGAKLRGLGGLVDEKRKFPVVSSGGGCWQGDGFGPLLRVLFPILHGNRLERERNRKAKVQIESFRGYRSFGGKGGWWTWDDRCWGREKTYDTTNLRQRGCCGRLGKPRKEFVEKGGQTAGRRQRKKLQDWNLSRVSYPSWSGGKGNSSAGRKGPPTGASTKRMGFT